jgi:hypothetical protein
MHHQMQYECVSVPYGKAAANRNDRKFTFHVPTCGTFNETATGLTFQINASKPLTSVWISCGDRPCSSMNVYMDGTLVKPNVDVSGDMISYFYTWVLNTTGAPFEHGSKLRLCKAGTDQAVLQRLLVWMQDGKDWPHGSVDTHKRGHWRKLTLP